MNPQIKSLIFGIVIGVGLVLFIWYHNRPDPLPPVDLKPYRDSIRVLDRERKLASDRAAYHLYRADSLERLYLTVKKKLRHDIKAIESMDHRALRLLHDSLMQSAGIR